MNRLFSHPETKLTSSIWPLLSTLPVSVQDGGQCLFCEPLISQQLPIVKHSIVTETRPSCGHQQANESEEDPKRPYIEQSPETPQPLTKDVNRTFKRHLKIVTRGKLWVSPYVQHSAQNDNRSISFK